MGWSAIEGFPLFLLNLFDHLAVLADQVENAVVRENGLEVEEDVGRLLVDV